MPSNLKGGSELLARTFERKSSLNKSVVDDSHVDRYSKLKVSFQVSDGIPYYRFLKHVYLTNYFHVCLLIYFGSLTNNPSTRFMQEVIDKQKHVQAIVESSPLPATLIFQPENGMSDFFPSCNACLLNLVFH